ncbi:hypothetical protein Dsin_001821 [Dipteronia sinensis]|uniref:Endonuclease/exonuclease/phosphatase domain-containing protein n=1 Tax=Dipteronia sinensis TaxID=43782 RepID=A0AAE0B628_9ROSI|nr:hypothetical protein Dsin_001821 [Dipteronia sinensis]
MGCRFGEIRCQILRLSVASLQILYGIPRWRRVHRYTFVYASTSAVVCRSLWQSLRDMVSLVSSSLLVVGDFNAVLGAHETLGSRSPTRGSCEDFRSMIEDCDLVGIRSQGTRFTWVRGRSTRTRVERRLDRVLVSDGCISYWVWSSPIMGRPLHVVINKLRSLKKALMTWNQEVFGDLNSAIVRNYVELYTIQLDLSNRVFQMMFLWPRRVFILRWMCCYADMTVFFEIGPELGCFMIGIGTHLSFLPLSDVDSIVTLIQPFQLIGFSQRIGPPSVENTFLTSVPSIDDIRDAVFVMDATSTPRLDGVSSRFYQRCWDVVNSDMVLAV